MEQRPLRLGDLVDDYCPRERRLTNHAIVAIIGDDIKQTRCTTCESEHVFKGGKVPVRKKKDPTAALYDQVLANVTAGTVAAPPAPAPVIVAAPPPVVLAATPPAPTPAPEPEPEPAPQVDEGWTLHRTLIRASLPRNENHVPTPRPIPEFTMHQRNVRGSQMFRSGGPSHDRQSNGFSNGHSPMNGSGHSRGGGFRGENSRNDGFRSDGFRGDGQPGAGGPDAPSGTRPPGSGRRRRRSKKPRPTN
jgi:hypothetical protein